MAKENIEEKIDIKKEYGNSCKNDVKTFMQEFNMQGLTDKQAQENKVKFGENELKKTKPKKWYHYLWQSFSSPFNLILLAICFVLVYIDIVLPEKPSYANLIVVLALIIISTFLEFFQVFKSNKAAEKLKKLVAVKTKVLRNR